MCWMSIGRMEPLKEFDPISMENDPDRLLGMLNKAKKAYKTEYEILKLGGLDDSLELQKVKEQMLKIKSRLAKLESEGKIPKMKDKKPPPMPGLEKEVSGSGV